jgi:hypothetical protein
MVGNASDNCWVIGVGGLVPTRLVSDFDLDLYPHPWTPPQQRQPLGWRCRLPKWLLWPRSSANDLWLLLRHEWSTVAALCPGSFTIIVFACSCSRFHFCACPRRDRLICPRRSRTCRRRPARKSCAACPLPAECVTLAGESVTLASWSAAISGPLSGSAARGPMGSVPLSAKCVTLAEVATLASSGIPLCFFCSSGWSAAPRSLGLRGATWSTWSWDVVQPYDLPLKHPPKKLTGGQKSLVKIRFTGRTRFTG